jgi:hypothetical protein
VPAPHDEALRFLSAAFQRSAPVPDDAELAPACARFVAGNERLSPAEQVEIYRKQFWLRHRDSLLEDYPGAHHLLGDEVFDAFCRAYLDAFPPRTPSLRDLGADVVAFAERWDGFPEALRAVTLDMIRYELAFVDVFDGPAYAPLDPSKLASVAPEDLDRARVVLHPLIAPMQLDYPVHRLRYAVKMGEASKTVPAPAATRVVLFRQDTTIHYEELGDEAFALLEALRRGVPLVAACNELVASVPEERAEALGAEVGRWFSRWAEHGWIVDVRVDPRVDEEA